MQTLTLESDRFIAVREKVGEQNQLVIIDRADANNVLRRPITADSVIMHPHQRILALKAGGRTLQVSNLETKQKVKSHVHNEDVVFWKWVNDNTLGLVNISLLRARRPGPRRRVAREQGAEERVDVTLKERGNGSKIWMEAKRPPNL